MKEKYDWILDSKTKRFHLSIFSTFSCLFFRTRISTEHILREAPLPPARRYGHSMVRKTAIDTALNTYYVLKLKHTIGNIFTCLLALILLV